MLFSFPKLFWTLLLTCLVPPTLIVSQSEVEEIKRNTIHDDARYEDDPTQQIQCSYRVQAETMNKLVLLVETLRDKISTLEKGAELTNQKLESQSQRIEDFVTDVSGRTASLERYRDSRLTSASDVEEREGNMGSLQKGYESALDRMTQFLTSVNVHINERFGHLEQDREQTDQNARSTKAAHEQLALRVGELEKDRDNHNQQLESLNSSLLTIHERIDEALVNITNLATSLDSSIKRNAHLESLNASLLANIERTDAKVVNMSNWIAHHDSQMDSHLYFQCPGGPSIRLYQRCNLFPDCADGSDEENCHHIMCNNGTAISLTRRCNLESDCPDGADEQDCEFFTCSNGNVIPSTKRSKPNSDCAEGIDGHNCSSFTCNNGIPIPYHQRCNLSPDCADSSDERNCDHIMCDNGTRISLSKKCDLKSDCLDGADEHDCDHIMCDNGTSIPFSKRCNFQSDCLDGADEEDCRCISNQPKNLTTTRFDEFASLRPVPVAGKTFNGSTLRHISNSVRADGDDRIYTVTVEFANRLESPITSYMLYDPWNKVYHLAPKFINPNTKEVFSFYHSPSNYPAATFSYMIPGTSWRLAVYVHSYTGGRYVRLAFSKESVSMQQYWSSNQSNEKKIVTFGKATELTESITVSHNNYLAKATLTDLNRAVVRIEVMQFPYC